MMETLNITDGSRLIRVERACINESVFQSAMMQKLRLTDVNLSGTKITNANMSDMEIEGAALGGAFFHHIGTAPEGHPAYNPDARQSPLRFEDCDLHNSAFRNCNLAGLSVSDCNLSGVSISDSDLTGMRINGIPVADLIAAYQKLP